MDISRLLRSPQNPRAPLASSRSLPPLLPPTVLETEKDADRQEEDDVDDQDDIDEQDDYASHRYLSFIVISEAKQDGVVHYVSDSVTDVLAYVPEQVVGNPTWFFAHPADAGQLYAVYQKMIVEDKAACLIYIRVKHNDPKVGYLMAAVTCTRVAGHLVGGVSLMGSGTPQMQQIQQASTAREVFVIAPEARNLIYARWNDSDVASIPATYPDPIESSTPESSSEDDSQAHLCLQPLTLQEFGPQELNSPRTALVLDRFSMACTVLHITNDDIFSTPIIMGRSFFDFVAPRDEKRMRLAMDVVKGWGVSEAGGPANGGFAFNKFSVVLQGRDTSSRLTGRSSRKNGGEKLNSHPYADTLSNGRDSTVNDPASAGHLPLRRRPSNDRMKRGSMARGGRQDELKVDAIFSPNSDGIIVILRPSPK